MRRLPILVALSLLAPGPLVSWDQKGHRTAAEIATKLLTAKTRAEVRRVLAAVSEPNADLAAIAAWADQQRVNPAFPISNSNGHFMSIPLDVRQGDPNAFCPRGDCLWNSLQASLRALADPARTPEIRSMALKFAVHLVADLHQPLHCADNGDLGGNRIRLQTAGGAHNFHALWDTHHGAYEPSAREIAAWRDGTLEDWLWESHNLAASSVYTPALLAAGKSGQAVALPASYLDSAESTASKQLAKAGVRLAHLLNQTFDSTYKSPRNIAELLSANTPAAPPPSELKQMGGGATRSIEPATRATEPSVRTTELPPRSIGPATPSTIQLNYVTLALGCIVALSLAAAYPVAVRRRRRVFISYRRKGTGGEAGRIADVLRREFGDSRVFFDVDAIGAGEDFRRVILAEIHKADVAVVIMGSEWAVMQDESGARRIMQEHDLVRREVAEALTAGLRVIPVLVYGASMPSAADLPADLARLPDLNAVPIYHSQFEAGAAALIGAIRKSPRRTSAAARGSRPNRVNLDETPQMRSDSFAFADDVKVALQPAPPEFKFRAEARSSGIIIWFAQVFDPGSGHSAQVALTNLQGLNADGTHHTLSDFHQKDAFIGRLNLTLASGSSELHHGQEKGWWLISGPSDKPRIEYRSGRNLENLEQRHHPFGAFVATVEIECGGRTSERFVQYRLENGTAEVLKSGP